MPWPICPECGRRDLGRVDRGVDCAQGGLEIVRTYACPCSWSAETREVIRIVRPPTLYLRRKYGTAPESVQTVSTES